MFGCAERDYAALASTHFRQGALSTTVVPNAASHASANGEQLAANLAESAEAIWPYLDRSGVAALVEQDEICA